MANLNQEDSKLFTVDRTHELLGVILFRVEEINSHSSQTLTALGQSVAALCAEVAAHRAESVEQRAEISRLRTDIAALRAKPEPSGCLKDILTVLRAAGRRLTTTRLMEELAKAGYEWSETTVKHTLAAAVASGQLTNEQKEDQRGYGLPNSGFAE